MQAGRTERLSGRRLWTGGRSLVPIVAVAVLVVAVLIASPAVVDGRLRLLGLGADVRSLTTGVASHRSGDLLSAADRRVIEKGGGRPPRVRVEGKVASPDDRVLPGQRVRTSDGADVVEPVKTTTDLAIQPVVSKGKGSVVTVESEGRPGVVRKKVGKVSGDVVSEEMLQSPVPTVVAHSAPPASTGKVVALTFDDGPQAGQTEKVLEILEREGVKATFFQVGRNVDKHPAISRLLAEKGMVLGTHSESHAILTRVDAATMADEIAEGRDSVAKATGKVPRWFRPPNGKVDASVYVAMDRLGMDAVLWTVDPQDWADLPGPEIARRVVSRVQPGSVVLLHDGRGDHSNTIEALPTIIKGLKRRGYRFVTMDELGSASLGK